MNRNYFLRRTFVAGLAGIGSNTIFAANFSRFSRPDDLRYTPCEEKVAFTRDWIQRFMSILDSETDASTREKIMMLCGKLCHRSSLERNNIQSPNKTMDEWIAILNNYCGEECARLNGNIVDYHFVKNGRGLRVDQGYCLCPILEDGPARISQTYCLCSIGYVKDMFEWATNKPVEKVELLESVRTGGKTCRFRILISQ